MKTIAIDVDDVISPFTESFIKYHNEKYGTNMTLADFQAPGDYWGFYEGVLARILNNEEPLEEYRRRFLEYLDSDTHVSGQRITDECRTTIASLKEHYNLEVVTARDGAIKQGTIDWLTKEFPNTFSAIHFNTTWKDLEKRKTKAEICVNIGADYIIDDSVEHCNSSAACGIQAILFGRYGWNSYHELHENVIQLTDWDAVYTYFLGKKS